jgi:hypothetical protein
MILTRREARTAVRAHRRAHRRACLLPCVPNAVRAYCHYPIFFNTIHPQTPKPVSINPNPIKANFE